MFRASNFDRVLDNATSHLHLEPDWPSIMLICDAIRQNDVTPKQALSSIKKKMNSPNPHSATYALIVLESVVKNCGSPIHDEICTKENCEMFTNFIETTTHENVKAKMLELIQTWAFAFRTFDKYQAMKDTVNILKAKGHKFPKLKEADAMFTSETAPDWSDGKVCHRCRVPFTLTNRKHHCRNCGQIFCHQCSAKSCRLPKFGIEREVRVCEGCFVSLQTPSGMPGSGRSSTDSDLPIEYLTSSLAQQPQSPPRKTEQELKEEEELELALALSQSEAESQKNKTNSYRTFHKSPTPEVQPTVQPISLSLDDTHTDPELAKYLNRDYWEQRKSAESPASPSAPSPMSQISNTIPLKSGPDDIEIDDFSNNLKTQVEIFVNRMKSNSSRGRSISTDSSVQTLFMNLTSSHSRLLAYIKEMDDKRMWFEQLQDKLTQVKDSRAALDVLRQEHQDKLRRQAEEAERQRQMQMAYKLEVMRKKKQEYLQYQRQLALQRIQEQERELQMRQEQQKAYHMSGQNYSFMPNVSQQQNSPIHQAVGGYSYPGFGNQMPPHSMPQRFEPNTMPLGQQPQMPPPRIFNPAGMNMPPMPGMMNIPQHTSPNLTSDPQVPQGQHTMQMGPGQYMNSPAPGLNATKGLDSVIGNIAPPGSIASSVTMPMPNSIQNQLPGQVMMGGMQQQQQPQPPQQSIPQNHGQQMPPPMNQNIGPMTTANAGQFSQIPSQMPTPQQQVQPPHQLQPHSMPQQQQPPHVAQPQQQQQIPSQKPPEPTQPIVTEAPKAPETEVCTAELISFD